MEGFQEGMQDWYNPILSSVKFFSHEVSLATALELSNLYDGRTVKLNTTSAYEPLKEYENLNKMSNAETNMLLRQQNELLRAILAKPGINNNDIFNAAKTVYKGEATRRYGDSSAFDPVWG